MDGEDQTAQDARVNKLWKALDTRNEGRLNLGGLKKGLTNINHRLYYLGLLQSFLTVSTALKNADSLLQDVMNALDTNHDGRIDYSEFRKFVEQTEKELWQLFKSIDRDNNSQLDKGEVRLAFERAGILLPATKLDQFFSEVDSNHDGVITFDEWRDFLLFIPANTPNLRAVLSYYSSTVTFNSEGDVHVSDDTVEGLGKAHFLRNPFAALSDIAKPAILHNRPKATSPVVEQIASAQATLQSLKVTFPWDPGDQDAQYEDIYDPDDSAEDQHASREMLLLTDLFPPVGYFVAGGIAGVVSRTATAPLDRLKVYLIAQVGVKDDAIHHAKSGAPLKAAKTVGRPLLEATQELWRMGGMRSLFAGNGLNVIKVMPESGIKFGSYEGSRRLLARLEGHDDPRALKPWTQFFAAGMGGIISQFFVYPLDTLKFRVQNETTKGGLHGNALILATARKMWATSGIRSFYRGLPMGLIGMFPYSAIDLTTFEYLKQIITRRKACLKECDEDDTTLSNFTTASIGAFSGAFGASAVYPLNLLRTRLQSQGTAIHPPTYNGMWDVTVKTVKGEGIRGLFKGITPNLLKVVPAVSITYVVYDNSKAALGLR